MVENLLDHLILKQNPKTKTVEFPSVLEQIRTDDAKFELSVSNTIKKLTLYNRSSVYRSKYENVVSQSIGLVFVNTGTKNLQYNSETIETRKDRAEKRMKNVWKVNKIEVHEDLTKDEVVKVFEKLKKKSEQFNQLKRENEVFSVHIRWIGWDVELSRK